MTVRIRQLQRDEKTWLHALAIANFSEIAPELPEPHPAHYDSYWTDADRDPFALLKDDQKIGFAMVRKRHDDAWELAEFYIMPEHRRRGFGKAAARAVLCAKTGPWVLGVARRGCASAFWNATLLSADWLNNLTEIDAFYAAQSHGYSFVIQKSYQKGPL